MQVTFVDEEINWQQLLPLTYTRPISTLRVGILTIQEKWENHLSVANSGYLTKEYLQRQFSPNNNSSLFIHSTVLPSTEVVEAVKSLSEGQVLISQNTWIAYKGTTFSENPVAKEIIFEGDVKQVQHSWDLFSMNKTEIEADFRLLTTNRKSQKITDTFTRVYALGNVFLEEGVELKAAILNAESGPIYLGKNAKIHEGAIVKGPFALCEGGQVAAGSKIREGCTIGVKATGGGELKNCIIGDYSNKGHDGYLGDSILGNWCNLGALTNVSNLKNTYSTIKVWDRTKTDWIQTEANKFGCVLGDYVHTGISTMLNTGTVIEPFCQLFGAGLHPKFVNAFQWGEVGSYINYDIDKAIAVAHKIQTAKGKTLSENEVAILRHIYSSNKF